MGMRARFLPWVMVISALVTLGGCVARGEEWSKAKERKEYQLEYFKGIRMALPGFVRLEQASSYSVVGESTVPGMLDKLKVQVKGSVLVIEADEDVCRELIGFRKQPVVRFTVRTPRIENIDLLGSGDIVCPGTVSTPVLSVKLQGSGDVKLNTVQCSGTVTAQLLGSGDMGFKAVQAQDGVFSLLGSGDMDVDRLSAQGPVKLSLSGSGDMEVDYLASGSLDLSLKGSGDMKLERVELQGDYNANLLGSGDMVVRSVKGAKLLQTEVLGSCAMQYGSIQAERVVFSLRGSGDIQVSEPSTAETASYSVLSSGDIVADRLAVQRVELSATGSGDISVHAVKELNVKSMVGSCTVSYLGNPAIHFDGSSPVELRKMD